MNPSVNFRDRLRRAPGELSLLLLLCAVFGVSGLLALSFSGSARWMPIGAAVSGVLFSAWATLQTLEHGKVQSSEPAAPNGLRNMAVTLASGLGVASILGFVYAVPVIFLLFSLLTGGRSKLWQGLAAALVATALVYLLFGFALRLPLTRGVF